MSSYRDWLEATQMKIEKYRKTLNNSEMRKYKLEFLDRIAKKVDRFSSECGECFQSQGEITALLDHLPMLIQLPAIATKDYHKKIRKIVRHLRKRHKLIPAGTYTAIGNGVGIALGVSVGAATENIGAGIGIGAGLGVGIGMALEAKAKKDGKII
jgi:thiamine pyrophosphate-dependent acetolactate synthase large subunit-like protein